MERFREFLRGTQSARAEFEQKVTDRERRLVQESRGTFAFQRPGRFRWTTARPYEQVIVGDGERVWIHDPDLNQVTVRRMAQALGSTPAALLAGAADVERAFTFAEAGRATGSSGWRRRRARRRPASSASGWGSARKAWRRWSSSTISGRPPCCASPASCATRRSIRRPSASCPRRARMSSATDLFPPAAPSAPLAERLRPRTIDEVLGQRTCSGPGKPLRLAFESGKPHSMILWGPPGTGKTTLARLMAQAFDAEFIALSAVLSGVKDIRDAVSQRRACARRARPAHDPLRRRGAPLQQGAAGRLPALRGEGAVHLHRRHHREPLVRGELGAALARDRLRARAPLRRGPRHAPRAHRARGGRGRARAARRLRRRRRAAAAERGGDPAERQARAARSTPPSSSPRWRRTCGASTRAASSSTTRSRRCTRRCAARTRTPRSTGW
jgi:hypothetical protein